MLGCFSEWLCASVRGWRTEVCKPDLLASICFNALMHCTLLFCNALHFCMLSFCLSLEVQFCTAEHPSFGTGNEHCTHICTAQHNYLGNQLCTLLNCKHIWTTHCTPIFQNQDTLQCKPPFQSLLIGWDGCTGSAMLSNAPRKLLWIGTAIAMQCN